MMINASATGTPNIHVLSVPDNFDLPVDLPLVDRTSAGNGNADVDVYHLDCGGLDSGGDYGGDFGNLF
jgi:hypothetical protein